MAGQATKRKTNTDVPRIYVASLADYNAGRLHGVWLDATDLDQVQAGVAKMLKASREEVAEDYAIHDHEFFGAWKPAEFESLGVVCAMGAAIVQHGAIFADCVAHEGDPKDPDDVDRLGRLSLIDRRERRRAPSKASPWCGGTLPGELPGFLLVAGGLAGELPQRHRRVE